ncbi:MAG TPA: FecR domain-containing protein [Bdellovibrionota bacterium]|nr:FecR domain-containing protein [Bdellovibrionota bacterium]
MKRLWPLSIALLLAFSCPPARAATVAGSAVSIVGQVVLRRPPGSDSIVRVGQPLQVGDVVVTSGAAAAKILLVDQTIVDLGPSTSFKIEEMEDGTSDERRARLGVDLGQVRASVNKRIRGKGRFHMRTKSTVMAVRGTEFVVNAEVRQDGGATQLGTRVSVLDGAVEVSMPELAQVSPVTVGRGRVLVNRADLVGERLVLRSAAGQAGEVLAMSEAQIRQVQERVRLEDQTFRQLALVGADGGALQGRGTLGFVTANLALPAGKAPKPEDVLTPGTFSSSETLNPSLAYPAATPINIRVVVGP